jgi:hypothetical protein
MNFEVRINRFKKALDENAPITSLNRKQTNEYLNSILETTSARNRNNTRMIFLEFAYYFCFLKDYTYKCNLLDL